MYHYKCILVALDHTDKDVHLIQFSNYIKEIVKAEEVFFFHVQNLQDILESLSEEYPGLEEDIIEEVRNKLNEKISCYYKEDNSKQEQRACHVFKGNIVYELLQFIKEKNIDLLIVGKQSSKQNSGEIAEKLTRKAPCSVFMVPTNSKLEINKIMVSIDFSEHSILAMEVAVELGKAIGISQIDCLHVYKLPIGYYKTGKSEQEFADIMKSHAEKALQTFIKNIDLKGLSVESHFILHDKTAQAIQQASQEQEPDLLILGAQGRNAGASLLLGSVTEGIIRSIDIPLLAVKKKGAGLNLLQAIYKM